MKKIIIAFLASISLLLAPITFAQENLRSSDSATLSSSEVINKDYYSAGKTVTLSGTVNGDAYLAGGDIYVDGVVNGDLLVAGGNINIVGRVAGNIRAVGGDIQINGEVGRNVTVGGGNLMVGKSAKVSGSLTAGVGNADIMGPVAKGVTIGTGSLTLGSGVGEDVVAGATDLTVQPGASVSGKLTYFSNNPAMIANEASVAGGIVHNLPPQRPTPNPRQFASGISGAWNWYVFLTTLVFGLLLCWLLPNYSASIVSILTDRPWASFGIGLLFLILTPIIGIILLITVVGIPIAIILTVGYFFLLFFARIFAAMAIGNWIGDRLNQNRNVFLSFVLGLLVLSVLRLIPLLGGLVGFVATMLGIGAFILNKKQLFLKLRSSKIF